MSVNNGDIRKVKTDLRNGFKTKRTDMPENVKISMVTNLSQTVDKLKKKGFWIVGTAMENSIDYREIDYSGKIALVIGNEGQGMSKSMFNACDFIAKIPMYGKINSLNASVAAGIMIYEVMRFKK